MAVRPDDRAGPRPTGSPDDYHRPRRATVAVVAAPKPVRPDDRPGPRPAPVEPTAPQPTLGPITGPPNPMLQTLGYHGSVNDFERRVGIIRDAYGTKFGYEPPPGLTFDLARSGFPDQHLGQIVAATPGSASEARNQAAVGYATKTDDFFRVRKDGLLVRNNPLLDKINEWVDAHPLTLHEQYPSVQMGVIPIPGIATVMNSIQRIDAATADGTIKVTDHGMDLEDFNRQLKFAREAATAPGAGAGSAAQSEFVKLQAARQAVEDVKGAQKQLNVEMGTNLPVTGFFNQTWATSLGNWMKTTAYFERVVKFQADEAHMSVPDYQHAWKSKQDSVRQHGLAAHFLNALPVNLFGHGLVGEPKAVAAYLTAGASLTDHPVDFFTTTPLHALTRSTGLTLDVLGGSVQQAKADASAANEFAKTISPKAIGGKGQTLDEAKAAASANLRKNPTWMRVFFPDLPEDEKGLLAKADFVSNVAVDLFLLRKPSFTGEKVGAGDVTLAARSPYLRAVAADTHKLLAKGQVGRAVSRMEGGAGAERLADAAAGPIRRGEMSVEQFNHHLNDLYANGTTVIVTGMTRTGEKAAAETLSRAGSQYGEDVGFVRGSNAKPVVVVVHGPVARSLRGKDLPTPGKPGSGWQGFKTNLRTVLDDFDRSARNSSMAGSNQAANFVSAVRVELSHVAGHAGGYFDPKLPERVFNATLHVTGNAETATRMENALIRARARNNVPAIQAVNRKLEKLYALKYPAGRGAVPGDPFEAVLATEAPSVFKFPSGGYQEIDNGLRLIQVNASKLNAGFRKIAKVHARIILATPGMGVVLGWKHLFGDTMRRYIGGGIELRRMDDAKREIDRMAKADPAVERALGSARLRTQMGEQSWLLDRGYSDKETFRTGEKFHGLQSQRYMDAAGAKIRAMITDPALQAYRAGPFTLAPLVDLILKDRTYRGMYESAKKAVEATGGTLSMEDYADMIQRRFRDFEDAAVGAGVSDPFGDALRVLRANRGGKADRALGKWVKHNQIDFKVSSGMVAKAGGFDDVTGRWLQQIMRPNKWNRAHFFDNILYKTYADLRKSGVEDRNAFDIAADLAEAQTKYHMLDFSNRLQLEQDLRWVAYFATKHRLYWKWVLSTFVRRPGTALAVTDIRKGLDDHGNINFTLPVHVPGVGEKLQIPAARLFWVPGRDYSETSPLLQFAGGTLSGGGFDPAAGFQAANGTNGNVFTRSDTAIRLGAKLVKMQLGVSPTTYGEAVAGMPVKEKQLLNRAVNEYQLAYFHEHGVYASEPAAVKHVLWHQMANEYWRANMPLPVLTGHDLNEQQKLVQQYMTLITPEKRRDFQEAHPEVVEHFGIYADPGVFTHNREMFARYANMTDKYRQARAALFDQAQTVGFTGKLALQKRKLDKQFQAQFDQLLDEDAKWRGAQGTGVSYGLPGDTVAAGPKKRGPWGRLVDGDPQLDPRSRLSALFPNLRHDEEFKVYGQLQKDLQHELDLLNNPDYAATYPDQEEMKTRRSEIVQQLDAFRSYPTDALGKAQLAYQRNHVGPYWQGSDKRWQAIQQLPRGQQTVAYAKYRVWRDQQDKPTVVDGVKFPSPVRMAWATLDPTTRRQRLAKLAAYNWSNLTDYEKDLLGAKPAKGTSAGWAQFEEMVAKQQAMMPPGKNIPHAAEFKKQVAQYVDRYFHKGFLADYNRANAPAYTRLEQMPVIQGSQYAEQWHGLLGAARSFSVNMQAQLAAGAVTKSAIRDLWRGYVDSSLTPWIAQTPGFQRELRMYGTTDFLYGLVNK